MTHEGSLDLVSPIVPEDADAQDRAHLGQKLTEHARLRELLPFFRCIDTLDANIRQVVETILAIEPKLGEVAFSMGDVAYMASSTCQVDEILSPSFFGRTPFPFRMLRLTLELHNINPIDDSRFSNVRITDAEKRNKGLKQLI